ncbi:MAG: endonuclease MutS2 [Lachnospiraceae bacterium]
MNEKALKTLEFYKIIDMLAEYASTPSGKEQCRSLVPMSDMDDILSAQSQTSDALSRIYQKGSISFSGTRDIRDSLMRLSVGSTLGIMELLNISSVLKTANRAKTYGRRDPSDERRDSLDELFDSIEPLTPLNKEIERCILSEDEINDDASPTLKSIRRNMRATKDRVHSQMVSIMNASRTYLQDGVITMRNGRYCIPVKQEYRSQVSGMVHDQSSSGSTVFIEPMAIVKLNNEIRELELKEQKEIEVILADLSNMAAEYTESISDDFNILSKLDFIFARAMLSRHYQGSEPKFNTHGYINIKKGRHPLLDRQKVVPIDIHLGKTFDLLIVTGPNTGGKTVSLKTVGLFTLMGQAGLHIPAFDGSELSLFKEVYADIGDEQSIEQSLSTFSSHMTNIVSILDKADSDSLVLFDELGAGTDPVEGAALAIAVLSFLHNMKIRTMATTHYSELKIYALSTKGVENACCEFDVQSLRPTYRLLIGIPGKSNAFAISKKLGLPDFIINEARKQIDSEKESFEDVISSLEESRVTIEKEQLEIAKYKQEIEDLKKKLEEKYERLDSQKERILKEANEKAQGILQEAKDFADETIKIINKKTADSNLNKSLEEERARLRNKLDKVNSNLAIKPKVSKKKAIKPEELRLGDAVKVLSMNLKGTVSSLPNAKGDLFVQMGILRSQVNLKDIEKIDEPTVSGTGVTKQRSSSSSMKMAKSTYVSPEVNLIGKTVDDALSVLDKYLDDAYLAHLTQVRVVHGRGTGALRNGVHSHLKKLKYVKSYRLGNFGEGDTGVTIVEFK